jgi:5S rRNA maturation endonuclease (ribonuclease M5)
MALQLMKTKKKSNSYNQLQLKNISDNICDNIEEILSQLDISDYRMCNRMISMSCPIHGGDNNSAFNLYYTGDSYRGNWKCRTHQCEKTFKASVIGFIRGVLSHKKYKWNKPGDNTVSFQETMMVIEQALGGNLTELIKVDNSSVEKQRFTNSIRYLSKTNRANDSSDSPKRIDKIFVKRTLDIPSQYFIKRGYSAETLRFFDVGECDNKNKEMYERAVVPIYDIDNKYVVGCSGRSIFDKCTSCGHYHNPKSNCSSKIVPKWKHSTGFKSEENLYNIWNAKDYIKSNQTVIIVESPGNVWRLHEAGIDNTVAIFGSSLSDKQKMILDISGAMKIITIMDNDDAGRKAAESIQKKCNRTYIVEHIVLKDVIPAESKYSDIGDMSVEDINNMIKPKLGEIL